MRRLLATLLHDLAGTLHRIGDRLDPPVKLHPGGWWIMSPRQHGKTIAARQEYRAHLEERWSDWLDPVDRVGDEIARREARRDADL